MPDPLKATETVGDTVQWRVRLRARQASAGRTASPRRNSSTRSLPTTPRSTATSSSAPTRSPPPSTARRLRASGEPYINHPVGTASICADLRLDTPTLVAALLHDVVEDTGMSIDVVREQFGDEVALLVDGVTKLSQLSFTTAEEQQAENIRKMVIAMAKDIRVILIKLADRLHNMRTLSYLGKEKQIQKAKETLEIYAPLAHRLGIESIRWELEDLAFATLHPRKFSEIQRMVAQRRADRERDMEEAKAILAQELGAVNIEAEIVGRTKHFYSIYDKMVRKGKEFNEIFDLTALRVLVDSVKDCYAVLGVIHSLWKPLPGRFKDYIAMPKFNMYQSLHTTVIGPKGKPLEIQIRTREMHETARIRHRRPLDVQGEKGSRRASASDAHGERLQWLRQIMDWQSETKDAGEFMEVAQRRPAQGRGLRLHAQGRGQEPPGRLHARRLRLRRPHRRGPPLHRRQGGQPYRAAHLQAAVGRHRRDPDLPDASRALRATGCSRCRARARATRSASGSSASAGRTPSISAARRCWRRSASRDCPPSDSSTPICCCKIMKETNHAKKEDFFVALGTGALSPQHVVTRVIHSLNAEGEAASAALSVAKPPTKEAARGPVVQLSWASKSGAWTT